MNVIVVFLVLFVLLTLSVPVGLSIGGATIIAIIAFTDLDLMVLQ